MKFFQVKIFDNQMFAWGKTYSNSSEFSLILLDYQFAKASKENASAVQVPEAEAAGTSHGDADDSDEDFIPVTDPLTQTFLVDPIKNKICGHVYGKASVLRLIRHNNRARYNVDKSL